jgi:catechol 2,3-dioxygenase-like lactoylglutathione lyase family enzyme
VDTLGLPLQGDDYLHSETIPGSKHFGIWPLEQAAQACFGRDDWPKDQIRPQASIEFEVDDAAAVAQAAAELQAAGYLLLHPPRTEPWGQTVVRTLTPDGLIVGICYAPSLHEK